MRGGDLRGVHRLAGRVAGEPVAADDGVIEFALAAAGRPTGARRHTRPRPRAACSRSSAAGTSGRPRDRGPRRRRAPATGRRSRCCTSRAPRRSTPARALETWYAAGLRSLGPVWSRPNAFGHGVPFISPSSPDTGPGLTEAGRALVGRCAELGILVDLSHLNEAGFWDVAALEPGPLVATHSAAHALCATSRNLTDAQLDAIGESGRTGRDRVRLPVPARGLRRRPRHAAGADRRSRPLRGRADRRRARRARIGLRRRDDPRGARRRRAARRGCWTRSPGGASSPASCARSPGTTGGACSVRGGAASCRRTVDRGQCARRRRT